MGWSSWKNALVGATVGVTGLALLGAIYGAFGGIELQREDGRPYQHPTGLDGAVVGLMVFLVFGAIPAAILGAVGGAAIGRSRARAREQHTRNPGRAGL